MIERGHAKLDIHPGVYRWGMVGILLLATVLRVYALEADLPLHISLSQGATTDGASTVIAGRNKALFGEWNPHGAPRNYLYLYPAMSWLSYLFFYLLGAGFWQANLIPAFAGLLSIVFMAAFARVGFSRRVALLAALFMAISYPFLMYNRTPMNYTPLTCGLAMSLYLWQKGLRRAGWFFLAGLTTAFSILFIKILGIAAVPGMMFGLIALGRHPSERDRRWVTKSVLLYLAGLAAGSVLWYCCIYVPQSQMLDTFFEKTIHTFDPALGIEENIRFAIQSLLQLGTRSGFLLQTFPIFFLSYFYLFLRGAQMLTGDRGRLDPSEIVAVWLLIGTILILWSSANQPTRYLIVLVPPMSLVAALALDRGLVIGQKRWPTTASLWLPPFLMIGLSYLCYQLLANAFKTLALLKYQTGLADFRVIANEITTFRLLLAAVGMGTVGAMVPLRAMLRNRGHLIPLPGPRVCCWLVAGFVVASLLLDGGQYLHWAREPQFSIVEASRQIERDLDSDAVLGGPYAYVLALENKLPAVRFFTHMPPDVVQNLPFTHLVVESDSLLENGPFNDEIMYQRYPELMARTELIHTYTLRGYLVRTYAVLQEPSR